MEKEKKPFLEKSFRVTFPKIPPYKQTGDFFTSKAFLRRIRIREYEKDRPREDCCLSLTEVRRSFEKTKKLLAQKREFAKLARTHLDKQWEEVRQKENSLRETFDKMQTFVQTNHEKRLRARQRYEEDHAVKLNKIQEIERLRRLMEFAEKSKNEMEHTIGGLEMFKRFLEKVVDMSSSFRNAEDLIIRYESLMETKKLLMEKQDSNMKELETARLRATKMAEEKNLLILGLNTAVADLRERYGSAFRNSSRWEHVVDAIKNQMFIRQQEINNVKHSCWNLYEMMCKRTGKTPNIEEEDVQKQLVYIKRILQDLMAMKVLQTDINVKNERSSGGRSNSR